MPRLVLVIDEQKLIALTCIGQADPARIARGTAVGRPTHNATRHELLVRQTEQMVKMLRGQAGDAEAHVHPPQI